jgi:16S rRNA (uracil1498-N3)-methyltransferase
VNLLILEEGESGRLLPRSDRRYEHVRKVLKKKVGERLEAGIATDEPFGPAPKAVGLAKVLSLDDEGLVLGYEGAGEPEPLAPIRLVLGFPRPIQATRIFKDLVSIGVADIELTGTQLGEKSYLESSFFSSKEYRRPLLDGAEQAANPRLPRVRQYWTLERCLDGLGAAAGQSPAGADAAEPDWAGGLFIALHPAEGAPNLGALLASGKLSPLRGASLPITLAIGSERGWTQGEVALLESRGFTVAGLGRRILKTETAALAASALALAAMGRM